MPRKKGCTNKKPKRIRIGPLISVASKQHFDLMPGGSLGRKIDSIIKQITGGKNARSIKQDATANGDK